jgi:hypothetical protein
VGEGEKFFLFAHRNKVNNPERAKLRAKRIMGSGKYLKATIKTFYSNFSLRMHSELPTYKPANNT